MGYDGSSSLQKRHDLLFLWSQDHTSLLLAHRGSCYLLDGVNGPNGEVGRLTISLRMTSTYL